MKTNTFFANRTKRMSGSVIREILKATADQRIVSLAGGLPASETFPIDIINKLHLSAIKKYGPNIFQYGITEGFVPLRKALSTYLKRSGINSTMEDIYISSGSQGVLDAFGKIALNKGDKIAVESPTYLGAMTAFNPYEPEYVEIKTDDDGLIPESLEKVLKEHKIKFIYLNPTFQNPTGRTLTLERRKKVAALLKKYNVFAIEDDPYGALRYRGKSIPSIKSMAPDQVVYTSTFSKIFSPGMRIGFFVAPKEIGEWMTFAKQGVDLHTSSYGQALAAEYLDNGYLDTHLPKIIALYKPRQEAMLQAMEDYFPKDYKWTKPDGGMFIWVEGPKGIDTEKIYWDAIKNFVAFVPGKCFFAKDGEGKETMRLNFTNTNEEKLRKAIKTLSEVLKKHK